jgi:hypothetical protein
VTVIKAIAVRDELQAIEAAASVHPATRTCCSTRTIRKDAAAPGEGRLGDSRAHRRGGG